LKKKGKRRGIFLMEKKGEQAQVGHSREPKIYKGHQNVGQEDQKAGEKVKDKLEVYLC
jgi:hypothetical protein